MESKAPGVNLAYALARLNEALASTGPTAQRKAQGWRQVLAGAWEGLLHLGSRTPVDGTPPWVTLEVLPGGFASGQLSAGGPLEAHELARLAALGLPADGGARLALNLHFLSEAGQAELRDRLRSRRYRAPLPEETALLAVAWLRQQGHDPAAEALVACLAPFFDRLRFYPQSAEAPPPEGHSLHLKDVATLRAELQAPLAKDRVAEQRRSLGPWLAWQQAAVALCLQAWEGPPPEHERRADGRLALDAQRQPCTQGGWPQAQPDAAWREAAQGLLKAWEGLGLPAKPSGRRAARLADLRALLAAWCEGPLKPSQAFRLRRLLASHRHHEGAPGSARAQARADQVAAALAAPTLEAWRGLLAERLKGLDPEGGVPEAAPFLAPVGPEEGEAWGLPAGAQPHRSLAGRLRRAWSAPPEALAQAGLMGSLDQLARLLPRLVAHAPAFAEPELQGLHEALHEAFSRRRSLLLLHLQGQVRVDELPWVQALKPWALSAQGPSQEAKALLRRLVRLALACFPHRPWPNPFLNQLRPLIQAAKLDWPLTEELAADIFMGEFTPKFAQAARIAAGLLAGSPYARAYGLPLADMHALKAAPKAKRGAPTSGPFLALCVRQNQGKGPDWGNPSANHPVLEWAQILTTHNLGPAVVALGLEAELRQEAPAWVRRVWAELLRLAESQQGDPHVAFERHRAQAQAFRQALFLLGWCTPEARGELEGELALAIAQASPAAQGRLARLQACLAWALHPEAPGPTPAPLLAWTRPPQGRA